MINDTYEIRIARRSDYDALVEFIDNHWKKGHIFTRSKKLLDWQHFDTTNQRYNFVLGVHTETQKIHGILGFITLSQFDNVIEPGRLCWMAIWKVQEVARGHRLGRRLMDFLEESLNPEIISTVAASAMTLSMYEAKGYSVGRLSHYYILNPSRDSYKLVKMPNRVGEKQDAAKQDSQHHLIIASESDVLLHADSCVRAQKELPLKSAMYLINHYFRHPIYQYQAYLIDDGSTIVGILITRICSHSGANAIRVIDFIGPSYALRGLYNSWLELLQKNDAEYMDFYCAGIDHAIMIDSGYKLRDNDSAIVIPNFFEPYVQKTIELDYMTSVKKGVPFRIVKGDSDQDRPSIYPGKG